MEKRREDLMACPNCRVLNSPDSSNCYGCGYELTKGTVQLQLARSEARFLRSLVNIFWSTFHRWTPFERLADEYPGADLILLADRISRKLEGLLKET